MLNVTIKTKLITLAVIATLGYVIIGLLVNTQLNSIKLKYETSKSINTTLSSFKSILIGGLMVNSATNVFVLNNKNPKPLKTISKGIGKIKKFSNSLEKNDPTNHKKISAELKNFMQVATNTLNKGKSTNNISVSEAKKLLKPWRALKFKIQEITPKLKKTSMLNQESFYDTLSGSISIIIIIMLIGGSAFVIFSMLTTKNILNGLETLHKGVVDLLTSKDRSSRVELNTKDELGTIAIDFNKYLQSIEDGLNEDKKFIEDVQQVMSRVENGWFSQHIEAQTQNPSLSHLKETINQALINLKDRFITINETLEEYTNYKYTNELIVDNIEKGGVFEELIIDINKLRVSINEMLVENKQNGLTLQDSSNRLLSDVDKLSSASNEAAASLEETAAALEEITTNITQNTQNIVQMSNYANKLNNSSTQGKTLASETTAAMDEINNEVNAINEAIAVIDQISFQTNILSLNAAVEAATAGEAGKGFAVVAQEVRNLASRSAEAANEIKSLVENATVKANNGKSISDKMIEGYGELNENISKTIELISDVESASKEQQIGIEQINDAVSSLDKQTQQNASVATNTKSIADQTQKLAITIVENANSKEFQGKHEVKAKVESSNTNKTVSSLKDNKPLKQSTETISNKPSKNDITPITSNSNEDDEWASF